MTASPPSVTLPASNGEDSLSIFIEEGGVLTFDVTSADAEFPVAKVQFALEFLQEIGGK